jgi:ABC-2 type transport system permease protein
MIREILANTLFELRIRRSSLSSYIYFAMFFFLALLMALAAGGAFAGATVSFGLSSKVLINSPLSISSTMGFLTSFTLFIIAAVFGQAICKDYINNMDQIVFSTPLKTRNFLLGRFLGALLFLFIISLSIPLGIFAATVLPFALSSMIGDNRLMAYAIPMFTVALPNIFIFGSFFFLMGSKTKKMTAIYITAVLLFLLWSVSGQLLKDIDNKSVATLLDPIGLKAAFETFRYWSVDQQNHKHLLFESYFLWNRLLWTGLGALALGASILSFSKLSRREKNRAGDKNEVLIVEPKQSTQSLPQIDLSRINWVPMFFKQVAFEFKQSVRSIYFLVITLAGVGYMLVTGTQIGKFFGTKTYPVTYNVLEFTGGVFSLFILIIITLYVGEAIWRDRDTNMNQIIDALPTPNLVFFAAKYVNLVMITILLLTSIMVSGMFIQLSYGYTNFEIDQYLTHLYLIHLPSYLNLISLTFFIQVMSRNKYLAHGIVVGYYLFISFASTLGLEHRLYKFGSAPTAKYSDMNQYGHLFKVFHIYNTYWLFLSALLAVLTYIFWHRGTVLKPYRNSMTILSEKVTPALATVCVIALLGFTSFGSYIFYQTNILNEYVSSKETEKRAFDYETKYKKLDRAQQPQLRSVFATVDIYPEQLKAKISAKLKYVNHTDQPIPQILVNFPDEKWTLNFSSPTTLEMDEKLRFATYTLDEPLKPGQTLDADYIVEIDNSTIENGDNIGVIHYNGTFFNNMAYFPNLGYLPGRELSTSKIREKYGLEPKLRTPLIDDKEQYQYNYIGKNASWIDFEAIVSTSDDQIALAPGYLQRKWSENGRNYFHYKMDQKIINFYAFLSARYEVVRDKWNDVNIEIYYHKGHEYNLDRMIKSTQKSLDYYTEHFGPYQHKQYRIIEFPRYEYFAQSFPNTIPFSEGIGFIARVDEKNDKDIDYPFYVNAHELAHQWWPHQMIGANVQGSVMLSESFSQYSALMVMEKEYGREKMKKFMKYELDKYLFGRGQEGEYESPLYLSEGQNYIHYQKASVIFYALKDYLGEEVMNSSMKEALQTFGGARTQYMTTLDFLDILKKKIPKDDIPIVEDMLEKIVLFQNRPLMADAKRLSDDKYEVTIKVSSEKIYSDKFGKEENADFQQKMDIGILDKDENYLYLKKHLISNGETDFKIQVSGQPAMAGIDPLNILIDRNSGDNIIPVTIVPEVKLEKTSVEVQKAKKL